ncbi:hypothetical protein Mal33_50600 [Rosistilla oblonga]|uniref:Uncharacterized protein n=1 Tax=Rosistilla oblonga TaxID=2527990 RepID=A0A518J150_9BACT|nr:hypothetical protein Mal33_50600 [Rosistilla oblonga]
MSVHTWHNGRSGGNPNRQHPGNQPEHKDHERSNAYDALPTVKHEVTEWRNETKDLQRHFRNAIDHLAARNIGFVQDGQLRNLYVEAGDDKSTPAETKPRKCSKDERHDAYWKQHAMSCRHPIVANFGRVTARFSGPGELIVHL